MSRHRTRPAAVAPPVDELGDMVADLTGSVVHREHYGYTTANADGSTTWIGADHVTTHPSLLDQLHQATWQTGMADVGARPGFMSKPTARLDAIDTLTRIETESAWWIRELDGQDPGGTRERLLRVRSLVPSHEDRRGDVTSDVRSWWTSARILAGWESPPWRPDATCPVCSHRGGLRVRLDIRSAVCTGCGGTWSPDTIGILADHIRAETEAAGSGGSSVLLSARGGPCRCEACDPGYRFWRMCPQCGFVGTACAKTADHRFPCTGPRV